MNKKNVIALLLVIGLVLSVTALDAYAFDGGKKKGCQKAGGLEKKFLCKAHFVLKNSDELGLSDKQIKEIKTLKIDAKKDIIRKKSEIDLIAVDIKAAMYTDPIDTAAINKLIDKKYDLKKEKTKALVGAYAALGGTLTEEQKANLKALRKKCKK